MIIKKYIKLLIFLITANVVFLSCSPLKRMIHHTERIEKLILKYPELKKDFKIDSLDRVDSININLKVNEDLLLNKDTVLINANIDSLFYYKQIADSLNRTLNNIDTTKKTKEKIIYINTKIKEKKEELIDNIFKEDTFDVYLPVSYIFHSSIKCDSIKMRLLYKKGTLKLLSKDSLDISFDKTEYRIRVDKKYTLVKWIKDEKTLSLFFIIMLLLLLMFILRK